MRSHLLRIEGNLNRNRILGRFFSPRHCLSFRKLHMPYFSRTMSGHTWQGLCKPSSKDDGYHCFPGLHVRQTCRPSKHVWDMVIRRLIRQDPPAPTLDALWTRIQTAWRDIPQEDIHGLLDPMTRRIETLIAAHGGCTSY